MWRNLAFILMVALSISIVSIVNGQPNEAQLYIIEPKDGDRVPERPYISGKVADSNAEVWIIVHPMEVSDYWVQPKPSVRADGSWKASVYVGRPSGIDEGKRYEIRAIVGPKLQLKEGDVLSGWPEAKWTSDLIEVIRK